MQFIWIDINSIYMSLWLQVFQLFLSMYSKTQCSIQPFLPGNNFENVPDLLNRWKYIYTSSSSSLRNHLFYISCLVIRLLYIVFLFIKNNLTELFSCIYCFISFTCMSISNYCRILNISRIWGRAVIQRKSKDCSVTNNH